MYRTARSSTVQTVGLSTRQFQHAVGCFFEPSAHGWITDSVSDVARQFGEFQKLRNKLYICHRKARAIVKPAKEPRRQASRETSVPTPQLGLRLIRCQIAVLLG
jgi:hypothetical protein